MSLKLVYKDLALGADQDAAVTVERAETFSTPDQLPFGVDTGVVATLEPNGWGLSHDYKVRENQPFAFWTNEMSDAGGVFSTPPAITIEFDNQYTATGLTFRFYPGANEWCSEIRILWYQNGVIKDEGTFYPNAPFYAVENTVEAFDKVVVELVKTSLPNRRAKLEYIGIGVIREIDGTELTGASFIHEINMISDALPMNVLDASFHMHTNADLVFQRKQPVEAFDGQDLIGVYYIEHGKHTGELDYSVSAHDAIGVLEHSFFEGGLWLERTPVKEILESILGGDFELDISPEVEALTVRGYMPEVTKREALRQIAFAAGFVIDTAGTSKIRAFLPPTDGGSTIPASETYQGGSVESMDMVSSVKVKYSEVTADAPEEGDDSIQINGKSYIVLSGFEKVTNPLVVAGTMPNEVEYDGGYMLGRADAPARAQALLENHMRRNRYTASHVLHDQKPGDHATVALPWGNAQSGNIVKMTITISGINASNTEFLLD